MTQGLSFVCLKCVFEHTEVNKRIYISFRCPALRRIEKSVPLKLDYLYLQNTKITINDITYEVKSTRKRIDDGTIYPYRFKDHNTSHPLMPGEIRLEPTNAYNERTEITLQDNTSGRIHTIHMPVYRDQIVGMKQLVNFLLGGRRDIRADRLDIKPEHENVLMLPVGLKIRVNNLDAHEYDIDTISQFLHESSFPLKSLKTSVWRPHYPEHPIIKSAKKLTIQATETTPTTEYWLGELRKLKSKHIKFNYLWFTLDTWTPLIQSFIDNNHEIGTCFEFDQPVYLGFLLLRVIRHQFGGTVVELKEPDKGYISFSQCIRIPMNQTSELCVYAIEGDLKHWLKVKIKVLSIGSSTPAKDNFNVWSILEYFFNYLLGLFMHALNFW